VTLVKHFIPFVRCCCGLISLGWVMRFELFVLWMMVSVWIMVLVRVLELDNLFDSTCSICLGTAYRWPVWGGKPITMPLLHPAECFA